MLKKLVITLSLAGALVLGSAAPAFADPNTESVIPADGVVSIERSGDLWTATFDAPPWEFKVISNPQQIVCGSNYGNPCELIETFTWKSDCVYTQVDWSNGAHNSSDPYVCRPVVVNPPTSTPTATPTPTVTPTADPPVVPPTTPSVPPTLAETNHVAWNLLWFFPIAGLIWVSAWMFDRVHNFRAKKSMRGRHL